MNTAHVRGEGGCVIEILRVGIAHIHPVNVSLNYLAYERLAAYNFHWNATAVSIATRNE